MPEEGRLRGDEGIGKGELGHGLREGVEGHHAPEEAPLDGAKTQVVTQEGVGSVGRLAGHFRKPGSLRDLAVILSAFYELLAGFGKDRLLSLPRLIEFVADPRRLLLELG